MLMENDEFIIPEKYRQMSIALIDQEKEKVLKEIKSTPRVVQPKKRAMSGKREINFYL